MIAQDSGALYETFNEFWEVTDESLSVWGHAEMTTQNGKGSETLVNTDKRTLCIRHVEGVILATKATYSVLYQVIDLFDHYLAHCATCTPGLATTCAAVLLLMLKQDKASRRDFNVLEFAQRLAFNINEVPVMSKGAIVQIELDIVRRCSGLLHSPTILDYMEIIFSRFRSLCAHHELPGSFWNVWAMNTQYYLIRMLLFAPANEAVGNYSGACGLLSLGLVAGKAIDAKEIYTDNLCACSRALAVGHHILHGAPLNFEHTIPTLEYLQKATKRAQEQLQKDANDTALQLLSVINQNPPSRISN